MPFSLAVDADITACLYALWRGGAPERLAAASMAAAAIAWGSTAGRLGIDIALLAALTAVAARADRYWPTWLAALHLAAMASGGSVARDAAIISMGAMLVIGTGRHCRREARGGRERAWSPGR